LRGNLASSRRLREIQSKTGLNLLNPWLTCANYLALSMSLQRLALYDLVRHLPMQAPQFAWADITNEMKNIMQQQRRRFLQMAVAAVFVPLADAAEPVSAPGSKLIPPFLHHHSVKENKV